MRLRRVVPQGVFAALVLAFALGGATRAAAEVPVEEDYLLHCAACHGTDGAGTPGVTPSLHGLAPLLALAGGRSYLGRVPGVAQAPLSDARLARLLNWVLEEYAGVTPDPPYGASEVGRLRDKPLRDPLGARAALGPR